MAGQKKSVLVVDDDNGLRMILARKMELAGYRAARAETGDEASEMLHKPGARFDMMITDVDMPGDRSGIDVLKELRAKEAAEGAPHIPVIVVSGNLNQAEAGKGLVSRQEIVEGLPGGPEKNTFISKPYNLTDITKLVDEKLGAGRGACVLQL
jgi:CheY-like chemotaxis protein